MCVHAVPVQCCLLAEVTVMDRFPDASEITLLLSGEQASDTCPHTSSDA